MIQFDKYVLDPLQDSDLLQAETAIGKVIPVALRELIMQVGFLQNAVGGDWPRNLNEFINMQEWMPDDHIAFMGDGAGNYYTTSTDGRVSFWDHEIEKISDKGSALDEFLSEYIIDPVPLGEVSWHTQMTFTKTTGEDVIAILAEHFSIQANGNWKFKDTSPADVTTYLLSINTDQGGTVMSKQSYPSWEHDIFYLNRTIPIHEIGKFRKIFDQLSANSHIEFKLVDYGIMPTDLGEDDDI